MYDPPAYLWAITITGVIAVPAATCAVVYGGAVRTGLGPAVVPLLLALHMTSVSAMARAPRTPLPATAPLAAAAK